MMLIACPWCGPRDEVEFVCGGEAGLRRPDPAAATDSDWGRYLFECANRKGLHRERWLHRHGCGQWFLVSRDTANHAIQGSAKLDDPPPRAESASPPERKP